MSRTSHAAMALLVAALLSGCGTLANRSSVPDTSAVVEEQPLPEPTCAPADATSTTPPEPVANYRDRATYPC